MVGRLVVGSPTIVMIIGIVGIYLYLGIVCVKISKIVLVIVDFTYFKVRISVIIFGRSIPLLQPLKECTRGLLVLSTKL